jgi:regulator of protease activity HflC (stomatin/prohibitin superfamily)
MESPSHSVPSASPAPPASSASRTPVTILVFLFVVVAVLVAGVRNVPGGSVGVSVNNVTGNVSLVDQVGLHFTVPYVVSFYTIDRTTKQLDMVTAPATGTDGGARPVDDYLNVKATDGDNVKIDVKVQYNVMPSKAVTVLRTSGSEVLDLMKSPPSRSGDDPLRWKRFERKWIWPAVRYALSERFNVLTREDMNEGPKRADAAGLARADVNKLLNERFGIEVTNITVENPTSYQSYELIVRQRKDTDQEVAAVIQEQSQELANQAKQVADETKKAEIILSQTKANNERLKTEAQAAKDRDVKIAEGKRDGLKADGDVKYADQLAVAEGKRKQGDAEAEGIKRLAESLTGPRGIYVIAAEITKRYKDMAISATPFLYNSLVQPYLMQQGPELVPSPLKTPQPPTGSPGGVK